MDKKDSVEQKDIDSVQINEENTQRNVGKLRLKKIIYSALFLSLAMILPFFTGQLQIL